MVEKRTVTHTAFAKKREGRTAFRWLEVGTARIECDGAGGHHVYVDRLPLGGFTGHIFLSPIGVKPPEIETQPERPGQPHESEDL
jgi:hypothetical protein